MSTVLTLGTFDLMHPGHVHLFRQCRGIAGDDGKVVACVNRDEFIEQFKGRRPVQTFEERSELVRACRYVDDVYATPGPDAKPMIDSVLPDFLVIGVDWAPPKDYYAQLQITPEYLAERNIALLFLDRIGGYSSTELKARIRDY